MSLLSPDCGLADAHMSALAQVLRALPRLQVLNLSGNNMTSLPSAAVAGCTNLRELDVMFCRNLLCLDKLIVDMPSLQVTRRLY